MQFTHMHRSLEGYVQSEIRATSFHCFWNQSCTDVEALTIQYSVCLIPGKSAQETKKSVHKHQPLALYGVHEQNFPHAEHGAIVCFTKLTTKQRLGNHNKTLRYRKHVFKC